MVVITAPAKVLTRLEKLAGCAPVPATAPRGPHERVAAIGLGGNPIGPGRWRGGTSSSEDYPSQAGGDRLRHSSSRLRHSQAGIGRPGRTCLGLVASRQKRLSPRASMYRDPAPRDSAGSTKRAEAAIWCPPALEVPRDESDPAYVK